MPLIAKEIMTGHTFATITINSKISGHSKHQRYIWLYILVSRLILKLIYHLG